MRALITGGCGFLGSNLACEALRRRYPLSIIDDLSRPRARDNLRWLRAQGSFRFFESDVRNASGVDQAVREAQPDVLFHLAGQVAMTTSIENPRFDFDVNVLGGFNVLEAMRRFAPEARIVYSSTNKVYGDLEYLEYDETATRYVPVGYGQGFDENLKLEFHSPYGCSKGAVDQYVLDYSRAFGLRTVVFRHSSVFGERQFSTFDQGWLGWFVAKALELERDPSGEGFTIAGDGKQVRDVLFVSDAVQGYMAAANLEEPARGEAFNIGGGPSNSISLLELFRFLEGELDVKLRYRRLPWRQSDQKVFVADIRKAQRILGWTPQVDKLTGLRRMIQWVRGNS